MRRVIRRRAAIAIIGICIGLVALGAVVFLPPPNEMRALKADLASAAVQVGSGSRVPLVAVAPFEWDRVYVFGPYTSLDVVKGRLGFDWVPTSRFDAWLWGDLFMPNDGFSLVVFVRGERDVTGYGVVSPYEGPNVYLDSDFVAMVRNTAAFEVARDEAGSGWKLTPPE